ncbi:ArgK protein-domain-containing protein [Fimicolochytrium jonesii]|uniref:ArgK protein-domain-containing protein n=1 Tax=Fimicolochytrium jonesii TaxID=1396493 RepID=UPI0022FED329|nr:ArgK protein-domain-containing protein [Fimicolochytrium jonesii]KAI8815582.1 ArgK protein-domain-containing protein [Fimicolochytrium jonesii]
MRWQHSRHLFRLPSRSTPRCRHISTANSAPVLFDGLVKGNRHALAKAITLVESSRADHKQEAQRLLAMVLELGKRARGGKGSGLPTTFRIGLSGSPGVGKSSFIETFGLYLISQGHKVAVLAVDPSSSRTGGSILGDKTRMPDLSRHDMAYIRPSPSSCTLGGVARNTNEAILLCEAGGYDIILVETVGVGQSETMVSEMTDFFTLLVAPGGGDELQGMKKGIVELSDLILVNKSDGDLEPASRVAVMEYLSALKFVTRNWEGWRPEVLPVSSHRGKNIPETWETMKRFYDASESAGELYKRRGSQRTHWMWRQINDELMWRLKTDKPVRQMINTLEPQVYEGLLTSGQAADKVLHEFIDRQRSGLVK